MAVQSFICPQCLAVTPLEGGAKYCRRCGSPISLDDDDSRPFEIVVDRQTIEVRERFALGELCNLYRCLLHGKRGGILKIARSPVANLHVQREFDTLRRLQANDTTHRFTPFFPQALGRFNYTHSASEPPRTGSLLSYHEPIDGPDELYSLEEVRAAYPLGVDAHDFAWIWRRLMSVLGFIHQQNLVHGSVTPDHVLIEPREHKLVLIGWSGATPFGTGAILQSARWPEWSRWSGGASATTDLSAAVKTAEFLLQSPIDPAIARHLARAAESKTGAWRLLDDFDQMIEALWGPRQFRPFVMPARG